MLFRSHQLTGLTAGGGETHTVHNVVQTALNPNETYTVYKVDVPDEALSGEDEDILNYDDLDDPDAFV